MVLALAKTGKADRALIDSTNVITHEHSVRMVENAGCKRMVDRAQSLNWQRTWRVVRYGRFLVGGR
jgi:hypothetical protein